jgi:hypothetical protein
MLLLQQQGVSIHNGPAINLISTIDIYDKLVITNGKIKKLIYFNVHHVIVKEKIHEFFFSFFYITLVMRNSKGISH